MEVKTETVDKSVNSESTGNNLPEMRFKAGGVVATVWANKGISRTGEETQFNTVSIERSYKDKDGEWKHTSGLRINDLPKASLVLNKAYEYIVFIAQNTATAE